MSYCERSKWLYQHLGRTTPTYDLNGYMTKDETGKQYVYDAWNRLVTVKNSGGTVLETLSYDGAGRKVSTTASGVTTSYYYSSSGQELEEYSGSKYQIRYVWGAVYVNELILRDRSTGSGIILCKYSIPANPQEFLGVWHNF